jgi:cytochrome P450
VTEASRDPGVFSSAAGVTNILNLPAEFNEYFGSMINMDDPRHARLRRIVSRAFSPRMLRKFTDDVERTAGSIVTGLLETGPCDFVQHVSARLPPPCWPARCPSSSPCADADHAYRTASTPGATWRCSPS